MGRPARRRFTILDAMVMAAATAVGLAYFRALLPGGWWRASWVVSPALRALGIAEDLYWSLATPWMIAITALRLRRPRPSPRRLVRQPGVMACCAALMAMIPALTHVALYATFRPSYSWSINMVLSCTYELAVSAVAGAWLTLAISGRWRPEPDWVDRSGRLLGLGMICDLILFRAYSWVELWRALP